MRTMIRTTVPLALVFALAACSKDKSQAPAPAAPAAPGAAAAPGDLPAPPDVAAPPADAQKTKSGLATKVLQPGTGTEHPEEQDAVKVHYSGWTTDGKMFDSSVRRGAPAEFAVTGVIKGWTEALQLMVVGEKRRLWIPKELAYNDAPGKPQGMLVFDVELLGIRKGPKPLPAPADVGAPPVGAERTASGLYSRVLEPGKGKQRPGPADTATVHYTGWTTDGKMFDSSVLRGQPITVPLEGNHVIPGWVEGVRLMVAGEKRRIWIPEELAYKGQPGAPAGMLVFDLELVEFRSPPPAPPDVAKAPKDAQKTASGLASKVIRKGTGTQKPARDAVVQVNYTGWTTDGKMFDSSVVRGQPATFPLDRLIPGWTEGIQLMVEGEQRRFWIPEELAYKGRPGPQGTLVFDVELLKIMPAAPQPVRMPPQPRPQPTTE